MTPRALLALLAAAVLSAPLAAQTVDFDRGADASALLDAAREQAKTAPSSMEAGFVTYSGGIRAVADSRDVTLAPGQKESAYVEMESTIYQTVCETPYPPYSGTVCRDEVMTREPRRFKLVLSAPFPAAWGRQTFRILLDASRRPSLRVTALDKAHAWTFKLPEIYEDVLTVAPAGAGASAVRASFSTDAAAATLCTLRDIVREMCVYSCSDGREIRRPMTPSDPDGPPAIACPQVLIPF